MKLTIILDAEAGTISKLSEEAETNESAFIQKLCTEILKQIALETKDIYVTAKKLNMENPYGFPEL